MLDAAARGVNETCGLFSEMGGKYLRSVRDSTTELGERRAETKQELESRKQKAESRKEQKAESWK
jgi:hypothetical protein